MAAMRQDILKSIKVLAPPLSFDQHKGQAGRIGIIGGSIEYTGAPYFAAISAMKIGADLTHIFCPVEAAGPIKCYSPELIVHPCLSAQTLSSLSEIKSWLPRLHSLVIGPGLGRNQHIMDRVESIITEAKSLEKDMVIDADGLHLITNKPNIIINYDRSVLTPNDIEFVRLFQRVFGHAPSKEDGSKADQTKQLALKMGGVTILRKGYHDIISNGTEVFICDEEGSPKRQGGQGDLLSGSLGLLLHWSRSVHERCEKPIIPHSIVAAYASSMLVKKCACITYGRLGRGMLTSDMVTDISTAAQQIFNDGGTNA